MSRDGRCLMRAILVRVAMAFTCAACGDANTSGQGYPRGEPMWIVEGRVMAKLRLWGASDLTAEWSDASVRLQSRSGEPLRCGLGSSEPGTSPSGGVALAGTDRSEMRLPVAPDDLDRTVVRCELGWDQAARLAGLGADEMSRVFADDPPKLGEGNRVTLVLFRGATNRVEVNRLLMED
jgi:hypothetical protein